MSRLAVSAVVLLLVIARVAAVDSQRQRGRYLLTEVKKTSSSTSTGSTPPSFKTETKTTGPSSVTVTQKTEVNQKGSPSVEVKHTHPPKKVESKTTSVSEGPEQATFEHKTDKDGNKVVSFSSGKRFFSHTVKSSTKINLPQTTITASGGDPMTVSHSKKITVPIRETKTTFSSGDGPSHTSKSSVTVNHSGHRL